MPILEVEIVTAPNEAIHPELPRLIANRAAEIFGSKPGQSWVKLRLLPRGQYAENDTAPEDTPLPVFVTILKAALPDPADLEQEIRDLTLAIGIACGRPAENVHLFYLPPASGRQAFGGRLVSGK